jgi:serine/threonine-protein kinase
MGTPYYMSPEQCEGRPNVDQRADVYSLGVILFEMMTGKVPFGGEGYGEIIVKHITASVPSPRAINPRLSLAHEMLLLRALAKNRDERFHGMEDFRVAMLDPVRYALSPSIVPTPGPLAGYGTATVPAPSRLTHSQADDELTIGADVELGSRAAPMPSTFREAAAAVEPEDAIPKSRGALLAGILVAALAAGGVTAFLVVRASSEGPPPTVQPAVTNPAPAAAPVPPVPPAAPAVPTKVTIQFRSEPVGAAVAREDTGEELGVTPFEVEVPQGRSPVPVVFKKANFKDVSRSIVPSDSGFLEATLEASPAPALPPSHRAAKPAAKPPAGKADGARHGKGGRPMDEDGVLAPSF